MTKKIKIILIILFILSIGLITAGVLLTIKDKEEIVKTKNEYQSINKKMYLKHDDILYQSDSIGSIQKDTLEKNTEVMIIECNDNWCKANVNNEEGYIEKSNLTDEVEQVEEKKEETTDNSNKEDNTPYQKETVYASADANIRSSMEYSDNIIGVLKYNESIERINTIGTWSVVIYNNQECYIASSVLVKNKIERKKIDLNVSQNNNIDPSKPMVAITFDDGPGNSTKRILDTLEKYNAKATFFDLGQRMITYKDIVKRESQIGEVGTHTYSHANLNKLSNDSLINEIKNAENAYYQVLGTYPKLIRPPYGNANKTVQSCITNMAIINWNIDTLDWKTKNPDMIINEVTKVNNLNGSIILMHSIYDSTAEAVEYLVPYLINEGYQLVTISELATYKNIELTTNQIYYHF